MFPSGNSIGIQDSDSPNLKVVNGATNLSVPLVHTTPGFRVILQVENVVSTPQNTCKMFGFQAVIPPFSNDTEDCWIRFVNVYKNQTLTWGEILYTPPKLFQFFEKKK
jgi:hypothetical protein